MRLGGNAAVWYQVCENTEKQQNRHSIGTAPAGAALDHVTISETTKPKIQFAS